MGVQRVLYHILLCLAACYRCAKPRIFADYSETDMLPWDFDACLALPISKCFAEYQSGQFDGSQNHRSIPMSNETTASLRPPKTRLLLLITTIWRNFQRRRLLRRALTRCSLLTDDPPMPVVWRFLLGHVPAQYLERAKVEATENEDMLLLDGEDEIPYSHIGDAYQLNRPNPEILKLVFALRLFFTSLDFDYLMVVDDDSHVNLPSAVELLNLIPTERVYLGNMIDSVPQRFTNGKISPEYSVNLYLNTPAKVPVFAHGMGFIVSRDVAHLMAAMGLGLKARGNDDMLLGLWFRNIEHLHYLHYWPWFLDHEEFGGAFTQPCDPAAVVIHRMNAERWRRFSVMECSVCGPPVEPLDEDDDGKSEGLAGLENASDSLVTAGGAMPKARTTERHNFRVCLESKDVGCSWRTGAFKDAFAHGPPVCLQRCRMEAKVNGTRSGCPPSLCHALCNDGHKRSLCPGPLGGTGAGQPRLAIFIFGSAWVDGTMRDRLRNALRFCTTRRMGIHGVPHVFMMPALPSRHSELRKAAVAETLEKRDITVLKGFPDSRDNTSEFEQVTYDYTQCWRVAEERFGGAEFLFLMDHRTFVNVPFIVHVVLPQVRETNVYVGCLIDETTLGGCTGKGRKRCDYMWRRRVPLFAHGMGFIISSDVARYVDNMAQTIPLRREDIPADISFGMWMQAKEDLSHESVHDLFHTWPIPWKEGDDYDSRFGLPLTPSSAVVFPMTADRWRYFDKNTCTLSGTGPVSDRTLHSMGRETQQAHVHNMVNINPMANALEHPQHAKPLPVAGSAEWAERQNILNKCWRGMGGRPEAWHLVCCDMHWEGCWGGEYTEEYCCQVAPGEAEAVAASAKGIGGDAAAGLDIIRRFLGFERDELNLFIDGMERALNKQPLNDDGAGAKQGKTAENIKLSEVPGSGLLDLEDPEELPLPKFRCRTPRDCTREGFARFFQRGWNAGILPLRHPWLTNPEDHLFGLAMKLKNENDGWGPKAHEHTFERVQGAHWFRLAADNIFPEDIPGERRCLEWDSTQTTRYYFRKHCKVFDVVTYGGDGAAEVEQGDNGHRRYIVDIHYADRAIPADTIGLVVCPQIFEHLRRPHIAMQQLFRFVAPGGFVVWSAPLFSEIHGSPDDFYRYTPHGANALAEDAGFQVLGTFSPGGLRQLSGYFLGMTAPYWPKEALLNDSGSFWPLQVYMILMKPRG